MTLYQLQGYVMSNDTNMIIMNGEMKGCGRKRYTRTHARTHIRTRASQKVKGRKKEHLL